MSRPFRSPSWATGCPTSTFVIGSMPEGWPSATSRPTFMSRPAGRNDPDLHSNIIALATGRHPGVSTLAHFPQGDPRVFARDLLQWARTPLAQLVFTAPQATLLQVLVDDSDLSPLVSLSGVADFLATWRESRTDDELGAPRRALPQLGILPDRNLLSASNDIADRLLKNFNLTREIARMPGEPARWDSPEGESRAPRRSTQRSRGARTRRENPSCRATSMPSATSTTRRRSRSSSRLRDRLCPRRSRTSRRSRVSATVTA